MSTNALSLQYASERYADYPLDAAPVRVRYLSHATLTREKRDEVGAVLPDSAEKLRLLLAVVGQHTEARFLIQEPGSRSEITRMGGARITTSENFDLDLYYLDGNKKELQARIVAGNSVSTLRAALQAAVDQWARELHIELPSLPLHRSREFAGSRRFFHCPLRYELHRHFFALWLIQLLLHTFI